jgi:hypothetical protein
MICPSETIGLIDSISEMGILRLQMRLTANANSIYEKTIISTLTDERKQQNYDLVNLLLDSKKTIDDFVKLDAKRMTKLFEYKIEQMKIQKELDELKKENEYLKNRIPC